MPTALTAEVCGEGEPTLSNDIHVAQAVPFTKGRFNPFNQPRAIILPKDQPIQHDVKARCTLRRKGRIIM